MTKHVPSQAQGDEADPILYSREGAVALIVLNRPKRRNALDVPTTRKLVAAVARANSDPGVGAMVITGNGPAFCAGFDKKAPPEPRDENGRRPNPGAVLMSKGDQNWSLMLQQSKPSIIAMNGSAIGLGVTLTLSADIRIAATDATFSFPFVRLGAMPEIGATGLLPRLVGFGRALDLCLRAATIDAREAERIGLVTSVVPTENLRQEAIAMAAMIAEFPAVQIRLTKGLFYDNAGEPSVEAIVRREGKAFVRLLSMIKRDKFVQD
jgi:2-(1,2-epoxy-1,2-dihydrophenyl)acetyl-CoA isomerase